MSRLLLIAILAALVSGCGPTDEDRYNTALEVQEREAAKLVDLEQEWTAAARELTEQLAAKSAGPQPGDGSDAESSQAREEWLAAKSDFMQKAAEQGTPEHDELYAQLNKLPIYKEYRDQHAAVDAAKRRVEEAKAAME